MSSDITEPESYLYIISMQMVSFLLFTCDYIVVVSEWALDVHLVKLIASSMMMVGSSNPATIIWYLKDEHVSASEAKDLTDSLEAMLGRGKVIVLVANESELLSTVMKKSAMGKHEQVDAATGRSVNGTEKSWLVAAQRYWETSIKKSTLFSDYARFLP